VACFRLALLSLAALVLLYPALGVAQTPIPAQADLKMFASQQTTSCSQAPQSLAVPHEIVAQARLKARLATLLRESLYDDAKGVVNVAREKEIRKLAGKLKSGKLE
jgi:hypothetical protein